MSCRTSPANLVACRESIPVIKDKRELLAIRCMDKNPELLIPLWVAVAHHDSCLQLAAVPNEEPGPKEKRNSKQLEGWQPP